MARRTRPAKSLFIAAKEALFPSRKTPKLVTTQAAQVLERKYGGNVGAMAADYRLNRSTVRKWADGRIKSPSRENAERLQHDAAAVQTTARGRKRRAEQMRGRPFSRHSVRVSRAGTFEIRGSPAVRRRDIEVDLTGDEAAALAVATTEEETMEIVSDAVARYFNGGLYGGFVGSDFTFEPSDTHFRSTSRPLDNPSNTQSSPGPSDESSASAAPPAT
ncbi:hypothetical protein [Streptomyces nanshensis]|uniref:Terminal protein n=1 Tax=Streptomyces nanshensis TaxID=518642 RepID=A0A1E7KZA6_9ACTN|nr:hypothetical protein [Streptomyces nanshensis]OEV09260.1 hypothetical protein AN218_22660 [Streptomyces nanshensis]